MAAQLYYDDVEAGTEIPPLHKHPTTRQLVKWAGATDDYFEIHYDKDFAQSQRMPGVIVHGRLKASFLGQLITDWIGEQGITLKLTNSYRGMDIPGKDVICKGQVTKKYVQDGKHCVECATWTENSKGEKTTLGTALVILPARSG
ncbi:MAG: MaoC/PaaZ C-terminal domain-containing protein [Chloroflexota bacterium]|nr:MaoC/PaaZ C-terminal domain-containing protein [Chloroflexota bacterium]